MKNVTKKLINVQVILLKMMKLPVLSVEKTTIYTKINVIKFKLLIAKLLKV